MGRGFSGRYGAQSVHARASARIRFRSFIDREDIVGPKGEFVTVVQMDDNPVCPIPGKNVTNDYLTFPPVALSIPKDDLDGFSKNRVVLQAVVE